MLKLRFLLFLLLIVVLLPLFNSYSQSFKFKNKIEKEQALELLKLNKASLYSQPYSLQEERKPSGKVLFHIKKKGGIKLAKNNSNRQKLVNKIKEKAINQKPKVNVAEIKDYYSKFFKAYYIPRCSKSDKRVIKTKIKTKQDNKMLDIVYINKSDLPIDTIGMFPKGTILIPYQAGKKEPFTVFLREFNINCLPARIKVFKSKVVVETGRNVIKENNGRSNKRKKHS